MKTAIFLLLVATALHAQTTTLATQKRLEDLRKGYEAAVTSQAGTAYTSAAKALDSKYVAALERMTATSTQGGKLDEAIALRDEKKRVTDALPLPESDAEVPEVLRSMRGTYREQLAGIAAVRDKTIEPLKKRYIEELQKLEAERTKAGNLDDALAIRAVREELNPRVASDSPARSKAEKPAIAKGSGKTDHKAAEQIITWALANNATIKTDQGMVGANEKLKTMPKGRFSVIEINAENTVPAFPWELLLGLSEVTHLRINVTEPITAAQTKNMVGLPALGNMRLIGPLSVEALLALPMNNRLYELEIRPTTGSEDITPAIAPLAIRLPSVTQLGWSSSDTSITAEACSELAKWPRVHGLTTRGDLSAACLDGLAKMPALDWLGCLGQGTVDPASLPKLKGLKYLSSFFGRHQPGLVEAASQLPLLDALQITMQNRTVADLEPLTKMKRLNRLGLRMGGAAAPSDDYAPLLGSLKGVTWLSILDSNLTDAGLKHLEGLKALEILDIKDSKVTDAGIAAFKKTRPKCKVSR